MKYLSSILMVSLMAVIGCSNHFRTNDGLLTSQDVENLLSEIEVAQSSSSGNLSEAISFKNREGAMVWVAFAPTEHIKIANVLGFFNYDFLGASNVNQFGYQTISDARVVLFHIPDTGEVALIIAIKMEGDPNFSYFSFTGTAQTSGGIFKASVANGTTQIRLESYDVVGNQLGDAVQLRLFDSNATYIGKISTLAGFDL